MYEIDSNGIDDRGEAAEVGDHVKVLFISKPGASFRAESMWVKVTKAEKYTLTGWLDNDPVGDVGVGYKDEVTFPRSAVRVVLAGDL